MRISLATPSLNQGRFLDAAMRSVLDQGYPDLEYVVVDGGSTDGSQEIIGRHADRLAHWYSGPDGGQYAALNDAFGRTRGEIMGWINADDLHMPWTLSVVAEIFAAFPEVRWITAAHQLLCDGSGRVVGNARSWGYSRTAFLHGDNLPRPGGLASGWVQQESTFWRRSLWDEVGGLDPSYRLAGDFDLWCRFFAKADLWSVMTPLAAFRLHGDQRSAHQRDAYMAEAEAALRAAGGRRWGALRAGLEVGLKRSAPRKLRRLAQMLGIGGPCPSIRHDFGRGCWVAEWT